MISDIDYFKEDKKAKNNSGISVAMCTCNGELFLFEQLESIAKQTFLPDELIICDDQSTDGTLKIVQDFQNKFPFHMKIYLNSSKLGSTKNFEKAISLCNENIIVLSDQDDFWFPNKLEKMIRAFKNQPKTSYIFSNAIIVDEKLQNSSFTIWERISFDFRQRKDYKQGQQLKVLLKHNIVTGATIAFRAELRKLILPIPEQWVHDAWIALLLSAANIKGTFIEETLIKYRQHSNQLIGTKRLTFNRQLDKTYHTKLDYYKQLSKSFEDVVSRLILMDKLNANTELLIQSKIHHLNIRQMIHEVQYWQRWYWVFKEILNGRYNCFSNGWKSVAKDLFF